MTFAIFFGAALIAALLLSVWLSRKPRKSAPLAAALPEPASAAASSTVPSPGPVEPPSPAVTQPAPMPSAAEAPPEEEPATLLYRGAAASASEPPREPSLPEAPRSANERRRSESRVRLSYEDEAEEEENTSPLARILISARGGSDIGKSRRANDDSWLFLPERSLYAVADGMGGYHGGGVASALAVETLRRAFETESFGPPLASRQPLPRRGHELASAILQANVAVSDAARATPELSRMGTTLVAARFSPNKQRVYIGHVGDSRCYRWRRGKLRQLTNDQNLRLIGLRGPGEDHLLQAIGRTRDLAIDLIVDKPRADDVYLLCSDGLPQMVDDEDIERVLSDEADLEAAVYGLIELANRRGGRDNVTVILVKVIERVARPAPTTGWSELPQPFTAASSEEITAVSGKKRRPRA